jgi:FkbH-like protein
VNSLRITGTSNLLANNKAWNALIKHYQVDFGEYGDWPKVFTGNKEQSILWVIFLEDLISPDRLLDNTINSVQDDVKVILQPLVSHLNNMLSPTLVAFATWRPESVITQAQFPSSWKKLANFFRECLYDLAKKCPNLHLITLDDIFAEQGMVRCFEARNFYLSRCRMSFQGLECLASAAQKVLDRIEKPAKKVLVLDCDNTLWGGVVGEVGLSGITLGSDGLGQAFGDFQRAVKRWASQGVLLTIASKNNEAEVWEVFENHHGMQIRKDDLVTWRINWQEKAGNLQNMANELDLGLDSFVFWDDNPLEREKMRLLLPEVTTIDLPKDATVWPSLLDSFHAFARFSVTSEDHKKVQQYKQRSSFVMEKKQVGDQTAFLKSIDLQPAALSLAEETLARAEQLCMKTNQFNLRTKRHTAPILKQISGDSNYESFLVKLTDRFGDHGIVCLVIARIKGEDTFLDTFLMSCRILGRHLESWVLNELIERLISRGCKWLMAEFIPSERNQVASTFLSEHGLDKIELVNLKDSHPVISLIKKENNQGQFYIAELKSINIPYQEVFHL